MNMEQLINTTSNNVKALSLTIENYYEYFHFQCRNSIHMYSYSTPSIINRLSEMQHHTR